MARGKKNNKASIGCLFWIALILLVLVIFLFNRETIQNVMKETGFLELIKKDKTEETPNEQSGTPETETPPAEVTVTETPAETDPEPAETAAPEETVVSIDVEAEKPAEKPAAVETPAADQKVRRSKMYFVEVQTDGSIELKDIVRPVYYVDSPLTETVKTLLEGLSSSELNMGLISLIPEETRLLSISIKGTTAYLNFSDSFRFNSFGVEGIKAQLKQVVYTATEFNNVDSVQILIEGSLNDYMGPEGVFIGKPLSRKDF